MKKTIIISGVLTVLAAASLVPLSAFAANGDINMTVKSELGYPVAGTGFALWCSTGNATTSVSGVTIADGTFTIASSTGLWSAPYGCHDGDTYSVTATTTGYVSTTTYGTYTGAPLSVTATTNYTLKVTSMKRESDAQSAMPGQDIFKPFSVSGNMTLASSTYSNLAWYLAASSTANTGTTITATSSGYVNNSYLNATTSSFVQRTIAFDGGTGATYNGDPFKFGLKVIVADQFGTSVIPTRVNTTYNGQSTTTQGYSNGSTLYWYNVDTTAPLNISAPGYLFATSTNSGFGSVTTSSTTQVVITLGNYTATTTPITISGTAKGLESTLKISLLNDELGNSIMPTTGSPFSVSGALNLISQVYNSGSWYVAASSTDAVGGTLIASVDGYVNAAISNVLTSSTTQYNAAFGGNGSPTYQGSTLPFSLKVNVNGSNGSGISGATVSAGNSLGTACSESGSSGIYYCAIPLADSDTAISASKAGYYPGLGMYTDRTLASDPQGGFAFTLNSIPSTNSPAVNYYSGGGGMSSGGGSYYAPVSSTVQPANCPAGFTCRPTVVSGCPQGYSCNPVVANTSPATTADSNSFTKNLELGAVGNDVRALQSFLNNHGYPIAVSGVGSVGHETTTFGSLTKNSLIKFQKANGIKPASGYFGPITRAFVAEMLGGN